MVWEILQLLSLAFIKGLLLEINVYSSPALPTGVGKGNSIDALATRGLIPITEPGGNEVLVIVVSIVPPLLFWTRELAKDNPNCSLANESVSILNNEKGNGGIIVGHTIQKNGINSKCGGKVWAIDTGMSDAFGKSGDSNIQVLEILNNKKVNIL